MRPPAPLLLRLARLLPCALALLAAGCGMQRTLIVDSEPRGARAWVDGKERGFTPVSVPYVQPGAFHVRLEKPGYASLAQDVLIPSGMADYPLLDLPSEIVGGHKRVTRTLRLEPLPAAPGPEGLAEVRDRAQEFRARAEREVAEPGTPQPKNAPPKSAQPPTTPPRTAPPQGR
jgi:hypothetical protein